MCPFYINILITMYFIVLTHAILDKQWQERRSSSQMRLVFLEGMMSQCRYYFGGYCVSNATNLMAVWVIGLTAAI